MKNVPTEAEEAGRTQIKFYFPKGSPIPPVLMEEVGRLDALGSSIHDVARACTKQRAELIKAGWHLTEDRVGQFLACLISKMRPANANTLDQAVRIVLETGLASSEEEALEYLMANESLHKALRAGISLWNAGLDLEDQETVNFFAALIRKPAFLEFCKTLVEMPEKELKRLRTLVDKARANG